MTILITSKTRANLYKLIDETAKSHTPIHVTGERINVVLIINCRRRLGEHSRNLVFTFHSKHAPIDKKT